MAKKKIKKYRVLERFGEGTGPQTYIRYGPGFKSRKTAKKWAGENLRPRYYPFKYVPESDIKKTRSPHGLYYLKKKR